MNFIPCDKCKNNPIGFIKQRNGTIIECDCHKDWRQKNKIKSLIKNSNLSSDIADKSWETLKIDKSKEEISKLKTLANAFPKLHKFILYIYGEAGCQKTSVAQIFAKDIATKGYTAYYTTMKDLIDNLRGFSEREQELAEKYYNVDLLIIDESFDEKKLRLFRNAINNQTAEVDIFLRSRSQSDKATILISNILPQEISANKFSNTCQDFIVRETINKGAFIELKDNYMELSQDLGENFDLFKLAESL